jgi:hypothetical protein
MGLSLIFLSPLGALIALGAMVPLVAAVLVSRRADGLRAVLEVSRAPRLLLAAPVAAAVLLAGLVGLAAAQPVAQQETTLSVRQDAEVWVVLDISRSMLARMGKDGRTRLDRAKDAAIALRSALPGVRIGVASLTDRVLPHLFPTADEDAFRATVQLAVDIERPPPRSSFLTNATNLDALADVAPRRFFSPRADKRVLVVITDGESPNVNSGRIARSFRRPPGIGAEFIHVWREGERVYTQGLPEPQYRPDPAARGTLEGLARAVDGKVFAEGDVAGAARAVRKLLARGPTATEGIRRERTALAPYVLLAGFLPLGALLLLRDR